MREITIEELKEIQKPLTTILLGVAGRPDLGGIAIQGDGRYWSCVTGGPTQTTDEMWDFANRNGDCGIFLLFDGISDLDLAELTVLIGGDDE